MRTGFADSPLHGGKAPRWLFERMTRLARQITIAVVSEYGAEEMLRRLSDPFWFQAFGCVLGFDWHSSGITTTVGGAMKQGVKGLEKELGFYVAGGKGATSRKTPDEITETCEKLAKDPEPLVYASRMSAKVDSAAVQDGFQLYHHNFYFTREGSWCVVQQGMNDAVRSARRYHWLGSQLENFVVEPHAAICSDAKVETLNLVAGESGACRETSAQIAQKTPEIVLSELEKAKTLVLPDRHDIVEAADIDPKRMHKILLKTYERKPETFENLLGMEGVGPKTLRALSLISEIIYGAPPSFKDPARFSYAHGGKDGIPYPVNRQVYDQSIDFLKKALEKAKIEQTDKIKAFKQLAHFYN